MSPKSAAPADRTGSAVKAPAEQVVRDIRRATRKHHSAAARSDEAARLLTTIPGIGPLNATAMVTAIRQGRDVWAREKIMHH